MWTTATKEPNGELRLKSTDSPMNHEKGVRLAVATILISRLVVMAVVLRR